MYYSSRIYCPFLFVLINDFMIHISYVAIDSCFLVTSALYCAKLFQ